MIEATFVKLLGDALDEQYAVRREDIIKIGVLLAAGFSTREVDRLRRPLSITLKAAMREIEDLIRLKRLTMSEDELHACGGGRQITHASLEQLEEWVHLNHETA